MFTTTLKCSDGQKSPKSSHVSATLILAPTIMPLDILPKTSFQKSRYPTQMHQNVCCLNFDRLYIYELILDFVLLL